MASIHDLEKFSRAEVKSDFLAMLNFVNATHPNLQNSTDPAQLEAVIADIKTGFHDDMSVAEAWQAMAVLNPYFGDAHVGVRRPIAKLDAYKKRGGELFPMDVLIDDSATMRIADDRFKQYGLMPGDRIIAINDIDVAQIIESLQPRMRGRSQTLRQLVMGLYFPEYFWAVYGGAERYVIRIAADKTERQIELDRVPETLVNRTGKQFAYQLLTNSTAYIDVPSFDITLKDQFQSFLDDSFARINEAQVENLIIDLRKNTGGAHDLSDLLMNYITDQPYSAFSQVTARVTDENISRIPNAELGSVVTLPYKNMQQPRAEQKNRFHGAVYVVVGSLTYSQAIVFATTVQDHAIAKIVGQETEGLANQSGQVQIFTAPNTGLQMLAPLYLFTRSSGDDLGRGVIPDLRIEDSRSDPMATIDKLLLGL
jgi:C-terminal processing protease CtpA/Prc